MKKLTMIAIILLLATLAVPTRARKGVTATNKMEILEEVVKVEKEGFNALPEIVREVVAVVEEPPLKAEPLGCAGVGESCWGSIPCCEKSGSTVVCAAGPDNAVCVDMGPPFPCC